MRSTEVLRRAWQWLGGALLGLYLAAPAYAFTPSDSPLLSAAAVAPNLMLLVDDSGSMNNIIWASAFNPNASQTQVSTCSSDFICLGGQYLDMTDTNVLLSSLGRGGCSTGWYGFYRGFLGLGSICLKLPDPVGNQATRYTANYLSWLVTQANGANVDYTSGSRAIPSDYRINVARTVSKSLVDGNRSLRIGLSTFNPPITRGDQGPGGNIVRAITDLSVVPNSVTQAQATTNYNNLVASINGLNAVEIGRAHV